MRACVMYLLVTEDFKQNKQNARVLSYFHNLFGDNSPSTEQRQEIEESNGAISTFSKSSMVRTLAKQIVLDAFLEKQTNYTLRTGIVQSPAELANRHYQFDTVIDKSPRFDAKLYNITVIVENEIPLGGMACCFQCRLLHSQVVGLFLRFELFLIIFCSLIKLSMFGLKHLLV